MNNKWKICPTCNLVVKNLSKHLEEDRCSAQHSRRIDKMMAKATGTKK